MRHCKGVFEHLFGSRSHVLTTPQLHAWALLLGAGLSLLITGYQYALKGTLRLVWSMLGNALVNAGLVPAWLLNFMFPVVFGGLIAGSLLHLAALYDWKTGSMVSAVRAIHDPGVLPLKHFLPMLCISIITISAGGSAGPEASVVIMGASLCQIIAERLLAQPLRERRIITLCGMSACLSAFFGIPLTGAIFVLEIPHHNGLEYYEAISPTVCASVVSVIVNKLITRGSLCGAFTYLPLATDLNYNSLLWSLVLGGLAGISALIFTVYMKFLKRMCYFVDKWPIVGSVMGAVLVGVCGSVSPSSLFWSENELQWALQLGRNISLPYAFEPGIIPFHSPLLAWELALNGIVKLVAIGLTTQVCKWPGGIIFPLFFAGATIGSAWAILIGIEPTLGAVCFMGALLASVLRTPWAAVLIIMLSQAGNGGGYFLQTFPCVLISIMISMTVNYWHRLWGKEQHGRRDEGVSPYALSTSATAGELDVYGGPWTSCWQWLEYQPEQAPSSSAFSSSESVSLLQAQPTINDGV